MCVRFLSLRLWWFHALPLSPMHVRPILDREMGIPEPVSVHALADGSLAKCGRRCRRRRSGTEFGYACLSQRLPFGGTTLSAADIFDSTASHTLPCSPWHTVDH